MGTLTVRENLMFSVNLRLPDSLSRKEKRHIVEEIIQELGLTSCANTKVSNICNCQQKLSPGFSLLQLELAVIMLSLLFKLSISSKF